MDIRGLKYFITLAECLNFTRAAKECYITQTAMSLHIAKMEEELGFQLFRRDNRNVELTPAGQVFYERARLLIRYYKESVQSAVNTANGNVGTVRAAVSSCIDGLLLMPRFQAFRTRFPDVRLDVKISEPRLILSVLKQKQVDVAICWPYDMEQEDEIAISHIADFDLRVVVSNRHPFASLPAIPPQLLQQELHTIIEPTGIPYATRVFRSGWDQMGISPTNFRKVDQIEELLFYVQLDNAVAILPAFLEHNSTGNLVFKKLQMENPPRLSLAVGYSKDNISPVLPQLVETLTDFTVPLNE